MSFRNLSQQRMFIAMTAEHVLQYAFNAKTDFAKWKKQALPQVLVVVQKNCYG